MREIGLDPTGWEVKLRRGTTTNKKTGKVTHPLVWSLFVGGEHVVYVMSFSHVTTVVLMVFQAGSGSLPSNEELARALLPGRKRDEFSESEEGSVASEDTRVDSVREQLHQSLEEVE